MAIGNHFAMKSRLKIISITLLMFTVMGNAVAGPWARLRAPREQQRPAHQQHANQQEQQPQPQRPPEPAAAPNHAMPGYPGGQVPGGSIFSNQPGGGVRKFGPRMSIEERQKLRHQINEAGQDIYAPTK